MPKIAALQGNFNAGELSPLMYGRTEAPRYKQGLATALNYIPTLQGPLARRPGTKFMNATKSSSHPPVLIPFVFSESQAYVLEFGDLYIRFYANNGQLVTVSPTPFKVSGTFAPVFSTATFGLPFTATRNSKFPNAFETVTASTSASVGDVLELVSPYAYTDVAAIRWAQNGDVIYLCHPNYPVYKLERITQTNWTLQRVYIQDGPYLPVNSYSTIGDNVNTVLKTYPGGATATTCTVGAIPLTISGIVADADGNCSVTVTTAHGFVSGQLVFISTVAGTVEANNFFFGSGISTSVPSYWKVTVTSATVFSLQGCTFVHTYSSTSGSAAPAIFGLQVDYQRQQGTGVTSPGPDMFRTIALNIAGVRYWGTLYSFSTPFQATVYFGNGTLTWPTSGSGSVATSWMLGTWSTGQGYPANVCFHQNRLWFSGVANAPQEVDGSFVGEFENFAASISTTLVVNDDNAISEILASNDVNAIRWMRSNIQGLLLGSETGEWACTPSGNSEALTPTNFNASQTSASGSANVDAIGMSNATLYVQRAQRKIREMQYFFQFGTFRSTDMTELSEHITNPGVTKLVVQKESQPLLWAIRSDGALLSMIYNRDDQALQAGWTRHFLGGRSDASGATPIVSSIAVIPSADTTFDQLWMVVQRYINGASLYTIEYMTKIFDDLALQEDAFQGDCGGTYDSPKTISGITTASPAVVTATAHGFSNGQRIRIEGVRGLNIYTTDINGNTTTTNLLNNTTFLVAGATTNTFTLTDFAGNAISSVGYSGFDSGTTAQARALVTTISGLTWLENETVNILADGGIHPPVTVSNTGTIKLQFPAAKVQIGYAFSSQGKLLRVEGGAADGTSVGKTRRTVRAAFQMHRIGDLSMGTNFNNLIPLKFTEADVQLADQAVPLFSGIKRDGLESAYDFESQVCFQQSSMLPGMIQSITSFMEEQDV